MYTLKWREFEAKNPKLKRKKRDFSEGLDRCKDWTDGKRPVERIRDIMSKDDIYLSDKIVSWAMRVSWQSNNKKVIQRSFN